MVDPIEIILGLGTLLALMAAMYLMGRRMGRKRNPMPTNPSLALEPSPSMDLPLGQHPPRPRYEHRIESWDQHRKGGFLTTIGEEGWRVVGVVPYENRQAIIYERQIRALPEPPVEHGSAHAR